MPDEQLLDVSDLPPPEPMETILSALEILAAGGYLRVTHRREPWPLFPIIEQLGYAHGMRAARGGGFEIFIWKREDSSTGRYLRQRYLNPDRS